MTNRKLFWFKIVSQACGSRCWGMKTLSQWGSFGEYPQSNFPQTFQSRLELNDTSKIIIKTSTRRRRSVDSDWSADFLWSGGDNLFDLSWLHLIVPILQVNLYSSAKQCMEEFYCFFSLSLFSWLSLSDSSCLFFFVRKELPPWPKQALNISELFADIWKRTMCSFFWLLRSFRWSETSTVGPRSTFHSAFIFALVWKNAVVELCDSAPGFHQRFSQSVKQRWSWGRWSSIL